MKPLNSLSLAPLLTQPDHMREVFQRELAAYADGAWLIEACEVRQARRRISNRTESADAPYLDLCYRLELAATDGARSGSHWWVAKAYRHEVGAAAFEAARGAATEPGAVAYLPALDLVMWRLPHDPGLPQLAQFLDAAQAGRQIGTATGQAALVPVYVNIVRHEPGEHCTARFTFAAGAPWRALYGKCFGDERWALAWRTLSALARQGREDAAAFMVPEAVACVPALKSWWQTEAHGRPLAEHLGDAGVRRALAVALVRLQEQGPPGEQTLMPGKLLQRAHKWRKKMVRAHAAPAERLDALLERLAELPPTSAPQPAHGDFHAGQMLLTADGRIALFDYDNLVQASRCHDAAHFVSQHLTESSDPAPRRAADALDFLDAWRSACTLAPCEAELDWMLRLMFLRKAYSFFVHQGEDWPLCIDRALALAAGGLQALRDEAAPGPTAHPSEPIAARAGQGFLS